jgi:3-deoxy-7-phosphoheptulonate synthase
MDIIVLKPSVTESESQKIIDRLQSMAFDNKIVKGAERTIINVIGNTSKVSEEEAQLFESMSGVEEVVRITKPFKLASREFKAADTVIDIKGKVTGGNIIHVIAGPCAVESKEVLFDIAREIKEAGASFIRGGLLSPVPHRTHFRDLVLRDLKLWQRWGKNLVSHL